MNLKIIKITQFPSMIFLMKKNAQSSYKKPNKRNGDLQLISEKTKKEKRKVLKAQMETQKKGTQKT